MSYIDDAIRKGVEAYCEARGFVVREPLPDTIRRALQDTIMAAAEDLVTYGREEVLAYSKPLADAVEEYLFTQREDTNRIDAAWHRYVAATLAEEASDG